MIKDKTKYAITSNKIPIMMPICPILDNHSYINVPPTMHNPIKAILAKKLKNGKISRSLFCNKNAAENLINLLPLINEFKIVIIIILKRANNCIIAEITSLFSMRFIKIFLENFWVKTTVFRTEVELKSLMDPRAYQLRLPLLKNYLKFVLLN